VLECTNAADVARLLEGAEPTMLSTDPPYGVSLGPTGSDDLATANVQPTATSRSLAAALEWPPAVRASHHVISPCAQARPRSIARRGRSSFGRACSKWWSTCCAQSAAYIASR
jgi:hypothetical protein